MDDVADLSGAGRDYRAHLKALLPPGCAFTRERDTVLDAVLDALAQELVRVDGAAEDLFDQALPDTTVDLLLDWERILGLPDACLPREDTVESRREAVLALLRAQGGQSAAYFIELAAWLGFEAGVVHEFRPFTANSLCTDWLYSDPWCFVWVLEVAQLPPGNEARDRALECLLHRYKPAHTHVLVRYAPQLYVRPGYWQPGYAKGEQP